MSKNVYKQMMEQSVPSAALIQKTKSKMMKEEPIVSKHKFRIAAVAFAIVMMITTTAFAAWYFLKPGDIAGKLNDPALGAAFESEDALNINASATSGEYTFTFLGVASGEDISDRPFYKDNELQRDRTYAVLAIQIADGTPFDLRNATYLDANFFVSPLIKGTNPALVNIMSMGGAFSDTVEGGVLYRIVECDNVEIFADRGLYFVVCTSMFYNNDAFIWNEQTGDIIANPNCDGASAVFSLPLDKRLADPVKAEKYLKDLFTEPDTGNGITDSQNDTGMEESDPPVLQFTN